MKITFQHFRFDSAPGIPIGEMFQGRHGIARRYRRGHSRWHPTTRGGYTLCILTDDLGNEFCGLSACSWDDNFSYAVGRENSLTRAQTAYYAHHLEEINLPQPLVSSVYLFLRLNYDFDKEQGLAWVNINEFDI